MSQVRLTKGFDYMLSGSPIAIYLSTDWRPSTAAIGIIEQAAQVTFWDFQIFGRYPGSDPETFRRSHTQTQRPCRGTKEHAKQGVILE